MKFKAKDLVHHRYGRSIFKRDGELALLARSGVVMTLGHMLTVPA